MRNLVLLILFGISLLYSEKIYSQGNTCADPIVISSLPYDMNSFNACGYGNDYQDNSGGGNGQAPSCASHWMNGDEVVFSYTPSTSEDVFISYQVNAWDAGVFILDGCPFTSANCLYSANDPDTDNDIAICGLTFDAGHTYYFVFSYDDDDDWNACNDFSYDFHIESINPNITPTTQDCLGAIPVCQDTYTETNSYVGNGNINCEVNPNTTCIAFGALNYVWYTFTIQTGGQLSFDITPNNNGDDYDWALYDLDNYTCDELYGAPNSDLACDFDGLDNNNNPNSLTGMSPSGQCASCGNGNAYQNSINVTAGQTFALMVNNFSSSQNGFTLDFSPSTASIYDNVPPEFESVQQPIPCGATELTFTMSENVLCNTADANDIELTGPGGPYNVTGISSTVCDAGGQYDNTFTITVSPALTTSGNFTLNLGGSFSDFCGNVANSGQFDFVIDNIHLDVTVTNVNDCVTLSDGVIDITSATGGTSPYTYAWSHDGTLTSNTANNLPVGNYSVTVTDAANCHAVIDTSIILVANCGPTITLDATPNPICAGESFTLSQTTTNGAPGYTYSWDNGLSGAGSFSLSPTTTTSYHVTVTDNNGDTDTTSITVVVNPTPSVTATTSASVICPPTTATLTATPSGGTAGYTYTWTPSTDLDNATVQSPTASPTTTGVNNTYNVVVTDVNGCTATNSVDVFVSCNPVPVLNSNNMDICLGESATIDINVTGGVSPYVTPYTWDNGLSGSSSQTVTPTVTTTYCVTVEDNIGATGSDCITITVHQLPNVDAGADQSICMGQTTAQLNATGATSYSWNNFIFLDDANIANPIASPITTTTFTVTGTDANGCENTDDVTITVNMLPTANAGADQDLCNGYSTTIDASGSIGTPPLSYEWDHNLGSGVSQTVSPIATTTYNVIVTDGNGCTDDDNTTVAVVQSPTIDAGNDVVICEGESTQLNATGGATYSWDNATSLDNSAINNPNASPTTTTTYTVTGTNTTGCTATDQVTVTVNPIPVATVSPDVSICLGENTTITASGGTQYSWDIPASSASQTVSPTNTTTYTVTVSDGSTANCNATAQVTVTVNPIPTITVTPPSADICPNSTISLTASGANTYVWSPSNGLSSTTGATVEATPPSTTTYTVIGTSTEGCSTSKDVTVTVKDFTITASSDVSICKGSTANIYAIPNGGTSPITYYWDGTASSQSISVSPTQETTYNVYGIDGLGCQSNTANVTVSIYPVVNLELTSNTDSVCPGDPVLVTANIYGGSGAPYTLTNEAGNVISAPIYVYPNNSETFYFTAKDNCGSENTQSIQLNSYDVPSLSFSSDVLQGCQPLIVNFNSEGNFSSYQWEFISQNSSDISFAENPIQIFKTDGVYDVSLTATTKKGCKVTSNINSMISVYKNPEAKFETDNEVVSFIDPFVQFDNLSTLNYNNIWSFGDGDSSLIVSPYHNYKEIGTYSVKLMVISDKGCIDTVYQTIIVQDEFTLYVPTAFTPDGDGINDEFIIKGHGIDLDNFKMLIYNRWGEIIWKTNDVYKGWNGIGKGNKYVENGSYKWIVICRDYNGREYQKAGNVTIFR